ncbi:unnamed protein product [Closterium sp. NIES-64]|nr:unnamed protein product [Closterium sp. NIES-64]
MQQCQCPLNDEASSAGSSSDATRDQPASARISSSASFHDLPASSSSASSSSASFLSSPSSLPPTTLPHIASSPSSDHLLASSASPPATAPLSSSPPSTSPSAPAPAPVNLPLLSASPPPPSSPAPSTLPSAPLPLGPGHFEYLPLKAPFRMAMGVQPMAMDDWIQAKAGLSEQRLQKEQQQQQQQEGEQEEKGGDAITVESAGWRLFTRSERETFVRLPKTGAVLFTIRTHMKPLRVFSGWRQLAADVVRAMDALPGEIRRYKMIGGRLADVAREYLIRCSEGLA